MSNLTQFQNSSAHTKPIGVAKALLVGHLVVNLTGLAIFGAFIVIGVMSDIYIMNLHRFSTNIMLSIIFMIFVVVALVVAWAWWSISVSCWQEWAYKNVAPIDRLQKWAAATGLAWPRGVIFEKTEISKKTGPVMEVRKVVEDYLNLFTSTEPED